MLRLGIVLFVLALISAVASLWGPGLGPVAIYMALLGMHAFSSATLLQRIARLQAAIDMRDKLRAEEPDDQ